MTRTLPIRVGALDGEALDSWLEAIAVRCGTAFGDIAEHVGIPVDHRSSWVIDLTDEQTDWLARATVTDSEAIRARTLRTYDGLGIAIDHDTGRLRSDVPWGRMGQTPRSRYCPKCLASNGGRWFIAWRLSWSFACTEHNCLLVDECPRCHRFQRKFPPPFGRVPRLGCCSISNKDTSQCGADLAESAPVITLPADHRIIRAQGHINRMLTDKSAHFGIYTGAPVDVQTALRDAATIAARVAIYAQRHRLHGLPPDEFIAAYDEGTARAAPVTPARHPRRLNLDAPPTAIEAAVYATEALEIMEAPNPAMAAQRMAWLVPDAELPAAERVLNLGLSCSLALTATQIKAYAPNLTPLLQLRYRASQLVPVPPATSAVNADAIASSLPSILWPEWSIRFGLTTETYERWRPALASAVLLVVAGMTPESAAKRLANRSERTVHHLLRHLLTSGHWHSFSAAIIRLADYLHSHGAPIDYDRRRRLDYRNLLPDCDWNVIAVRAGALPGSAVKAELARRFLFRRISGMSAAREAEDDRCVPQWQTRTLNFPLELTSELRNSLDRAGIAFLTANGISDEPLAWHPPPKILDGLAMPVPEPELVDTEALRTAASVASARVPALAKTFGVGIGTVRYLLERHPPEPSEARGKTVRRDVVRAARYKSLTKELLYELHHEQRLGCTAIGARFGMSSGSVRRLADHYGIKLRSHATHVEFEWLHENYVVARRTQTELCAELGISLPTLRKWIDRHDLPLRQEVRPSCFELSETQARRLLCRTLSRPAGLAHLANLVRATEYQSICEAAEHLDINRMTLTSQIRDVGTDCGGPLLRRWTPNRPMAPTALGGKVVAAYEVLFGSRTSPSRGAD
ncbi:hypothetical protein E3G55_002587 [Mycobacteroides abscessus]|nr:hypothetical protein [Mycobacteroides abscessus]